MDYSARIKILKQNVCPLINPYYTLKNCMNLDKNMSKAWIDFTLQKKSFKSEKKPHTASDTEKNNDVES